MFVRSLRIAAALGLVALLASCSLLFGRSIDRPLVYFVRNVTVMADARIPLDLIDSVDRRVSAAIAATRPPAGAERVVLLVKIDHLGFGEGARRRLAERDSPSPPHRSKPAIRSLRAPSSSTARPTILAGRARLWQRKSQPASVLLFR